VNEVWGNAEDAEGEAADGREADGVCKVGRIEFDLCKVPDQNIIPVAFRQDRQKKKGGSAFACIIKTLSYLQEFIY
jgi:hypothetical protein